MITSVCFIYLPFSVIIKLYFFHIYNSKETFIMTQHRKYLYFIPMVLWMIFIFWMSHQTGDDSGELSNVIVVWILNHTPLAITELSFIVRKAAHIFEYFVLFLLAYYGFIHCTSSKRFLQKSPLLLSYCTAFIYACTDEFHQMFVPGRGPAVKDVFIDSIGITIGLLLILLLIKPSNRQSLS